MTLLYTNRNFGAACIEPLTPKWVQLVKALHLKGQYQTN